MPFSNHSAAITAIFNSTVTQMLQFADKHLRNTVSASIATSVEVATTTNNTPHHFIVSTAAESVLSSTSASSTVLASLNTQALYQIPVYTVILLLSVAGNALVILTLVQNRRMRTITNVFLLNLAVSDLLLGVLCMPITLVGALLRDFVFGGVMCKLMPYLQGKSFHGKMFGSVLRQIQFKNLTSNAIEQCSQKANEQKRA